MNNEILRRQGAFLPHWTREGGAYSVTFRLNDALPQCVIAEIERLRVQLAEMQLRSESIAMTIRKHRAFAARVDEYLNAGHGASYFLQPRFAAIMQDALLYFDRERYDLLAWAVMLNHVHVLVKPLAGFGLPSILQSWKGFTGRVINSALGRSGPLWQCEYYDHLIRGDEDLDHHRGYILGNPAAAGLRDWPWVGERK